LPEVLTQAQATVHSYRYTHDTIGNRTSMTDTSGAHNYAYDELYRLIEATHPTMPTEEFSYDPVGNRMGTTVNAANRLLDDGSYTYAYDNNGNLTGKTSKTDPNDVTTYVYDPENRLVQVTAQGMSASYLYDPFGRRIQKTVNGVPTGYLYDNEDIIAEYDSTGTVTTAYTHGPGIDEPLSMARGTETYFYHADGLGSVTTMTDQTGAIAQKYEYDAYGKITLTLDPSPVQPYTYTAREHDGETGLYFYRARYYDATVGRFISEDPIRFAGGDVNLYSYVRNQPTRYIDPWGLYLGQVPPAPPGYNPLTWKSGLFDDGTVFLEDPTGTKWLLHPEDKGHWRHWDKQGPGGKDEGDWPPNPGKRRPGQKKLKPNQCDIDPSGDAPEWTPPPGFFPFMPLDPLEVPIRIPVRVPIRIPIPVW